MPFMLRETSRDVFAWVATDGSTTQGAVHLQTNYNNRSSVLDFEVGIVIDDESFAETVERRLYHDDVDNGLTVERDGALLPKEAAMIMPALATYELWGTFL